MAGNSSTRTKASGSRGAIEDGQAVQTEGGERGRTVGVQNAGAALCLRAKMLRGRHAWLAVASMHKHH